MHILGVVKFTQPRPDLSVILTPGAVRISGIAFSGLRYS